MSTKAMHESKEKLCDLLDRINRNGEIKLGDLEAIDHLTNSIKNLMKISQMEEGGYSYGMGDWNASGNYSNRGYSNDGYSNRSYANDSMSMGHYVRGHYSNGDMITERIEEMMNDGRMSTADKDTLRRAMEVLRR